MVTTVVTLNNVSLALWNSDTGLQNRLKSAIAAAAGVTVDKVIFSNARARTGGGSRRLLSLQGAKHVIDVVANVMDAREINDLDKHMLRLGIQTQGHIWSPNHIVLRRRRPEVLKPFI